jgi:hypothetical protein
MDTQYYNLDMRVFPMSNSWYDFLIDYSTDRNYEDLLIHESIILQTVLSQ